MLQPPSLYDALLACFPEVFVGLGIMKPALLLKHMLFPSSIKLGQGLKKDMAGSMTARLSRVLLALHSHTTEHHQFVTGRVVDGENPRNEAGHPDLIPQSGWSKKQQVQKEKHNKSAKVGTFRIGDHEKTRL